MRLRTTCMECFRVDGKPSELANSVELRDDGLYQITCSRGHVTVTAIQEQKFEILFDLGAMALLDGYTREAVSSIAASLGQSVKLVSHLMKGMLQIGGRHTDSRRPLVRWREKMRAIDLLVAKHCVLHSVLRHATG